MSGDDEKLLARLLDGSLDEEQARLFLRRLDEDPELLDAAARQWRVDRALDSAGADGQEDALARSVRIALGGSESSSAHLSFRVADRLRRRRRRRVSERPATLAWIAVGVAAAAALALAALLPNRTPEARPAAQRSLPAPEAPAVVPEAPPPAPRPAPPAPAPAFEIPLTPAPPPPPPPPPPPAPPPPAPAPPPATVAAPRRAVARVERASGSALLRREPATAGAEIFEGDEIETAGGALEARFPDGTALRLAANTLVRGMADGPGGKRASVGKGDVSARVSRQPAERPMRFDTPHGEATVLGTTLRLVVEAGSTRLEVTEGKVRLARLSDRRHADVVAGQFAVAGPGPAPAARPLAAEADPLSIEIEDFGSARGVSPAEGVARRIHLEPFPDASGGRSVAVPGVGTEISGELVLPGGDAFLWIRYRDDNDGAASFDVLANGTPLAKVAGEGKTKAWRWARIALRGKGKLRLTLRSTSEGVLQKNPQEDLRQHPYAIVNRWDRLVLTRDPDHRPD